MDTENNLIAKQLASAPREIKDALSKGMWSLVVSEIARRNNFSSDHATSLENEALFVLLGLEFLGDFQKNIKEGVGLSDALSQSIAQEIYEKIFKLVEEFLPTEVEEDELPAGSNLIEDSAGNADNVRSELGSMNYELRKEGGGVKPNENQKEKWWEKEAPRFVDTKNNEEGIMNYDKEQKTPQAIPEPVTQKPFGSAPAGAEALTGKQDRPSLDILHGQAEGGVTNLEKKLGALNTSNDGNQVIERRYPAQDPYREPLN